MPEDQELRPLFVRLHRELDAERLGNASHADAIVDCIIGLRSMIHRDEATAISELYGPLGCLERLAEERYGHTERNEDYHRWSIRWNAAVAQACAFVRNVLAVSPV